MPDLCWSDIERICSCQITEVKQQWAWSLQRWVIIWSHSKFCKQALTCQLSKKRDLLKTSFRVTIYMCVCVCSWAAGFHLSMFDKIIKSFCLYNLIKILSSFLISILVSGYTYYFLLRQSPKGHLNIYSLCSTACNSWVKRDFLNSLRTLCVSVFRVFIFFFIVVDLSYYMILQLTTILTPKSIAVVF